MAPRDTPLQTSIPAQLAVVLVATHNGEPWLDEQLLSIEQQDWSAIDIWVSDDGSTDGTLSILRAWQGRWSKGRFEILSGPRSGFADNFRHLVLTVDQGAAFYAFCDQDDVWLPGKLRAAAASIGTAAAPVLYCGRTIIANQAGEAQRLSEHFRAPPSFRNALVQSIAGGNTMVLNASAFAVVREAMRRTVFVSHDWFSYQIISGTGGTVHFALEPQIYYRQHGGNLVGSNRGMLARLRRLAMVLDGRFARWSETNIAALRACQSLLTPDSVHSLDAFERARKVSFWSRLPQLRQAGVYRQTVAGQISLYAACLLGKM